MSGVIRRASCRCGQLSAETTGDPVRVSACHCLACQKRSGSSFAVQARWPDDRIVVTGDSRTWTRIADSGQRAHFRFCPECGSTVAYKNESMPGVTAVPVGAFADPQFPPPQYSIYEQRKHAWVEILGDDVEHID